MIVIILVSNLRDNIAICALQINYELNHQKSEFTYRKNQLITLNVVNILDCFNAILPSTIALFVTFCIRFFAKANKEGAQKEEQKDDASVLYDEGQMESFTDFLNVSLDDMNE